MELNSLGAAREDTHGTPEKLRGKMYSFFCFFFLSFSFSLSFTLVPRACHSPTPSAFSATSLPFHSYGNHPRTLSLLAPSPSSPISAFGTRLPLLEWLRDDNEDCDVSYPLALYPPPQPTLLFGVNGRSTLIRVLFLGQICLGKCIYIYTRTRV